MQALHDLMTFCEERGFAGWDPYDGLNSRLFKMSGLANFPLARLAWIQTFKRNPVNLRKILAVPEGINPKGTGLFLSGYSKLLQHCRGSAYHGFSVQHLEQIIHQLAGTLIEEQSSGYAGPCWGYNFDWQARGGLFFPAKTPTVVATTYASYGLFDAFDATGNEEYLEHAIGSANFVTQNLNRSYRPSGHFLFSYSPLPGNNCVYNASLLGSKLLARCHAYSPNPGNLAIAKASVAAAIEAQEKDGSWKYGEGPTQTWKDSFHTGFNLEALADYMQHSGDKSIQAAIDSGFSFYIEKFFTRTGEPKYYHDRLFPIDIHSPAQLIVTLDKLGLIDHHRALLEKVVKWTINNMQDSDGFFYYQKKPRFTIRIPYMRWSQAWMMHALSLYFIHTSNDSHRNN